MTDPSFRFAAWARVSTEEQAIDKESLSKQIEECRAYAERLGGKETAGPFVAEGYSGSFFEGLPEGMDAIPALKEAIRAADKNQYDVLMVRYFDRLGVLAEPIFIRLSKTRKQLVSVQESVPISPPSLYDPAKNDSTATMISIARIKQHHRINRLINNLRDTMPKRIRDGLTPTRMPRGYIHTNAKTPPDLDPTFAAKLLRAYKMLMKGKSYESIAPVLGVDGSRVRYILSNSYYAGVVSYNKTYIQRLGTERKIIPLPKSKWTVGEGKHKAVFTTQEHEAILAEIDRRDQIVRRKHSTFIFAGLLRCAVPGCGGRVRKSTFNHKTVVVCRVGGVRHVVHDYDHFFHMVVSGIQKKTKQIQAGEWEETEDKSEIIRRAIEENKKRRKNVQDGIEMGSFSQAEGLKKIKELERDEERLHKDLERTTTERVNRHETAAFITELDVSEIPDWLKEENPLYLNRLLVAWLKEIRVGEKVEIITR